MAATTKRLLWLLAILLGWISCGAPAAIAGPLPTIGGALASWKGTKSFSGDNASSALRVNVEYAVFPPGAFNDSLTLGNPVDPSNEADYVYAFQAVNLPAGTVRMSLLSIGLDPGAIPTASTRIGHLAGMPGGTLAPNVTQFTPGGDPKQSAQWSYGSTSLMPNNASEILFFTSPFPPQLLLSSMQGGQGTFDSQLLPSPAPEPATIVLAGLALLGMLGFARSGKR